MKKIKLFYMGKRLKDIYPHATKWQIFKYKVRKFFEKLFIGIITISVLIGIFKAGGYLKPEIVYKSVKEEVILDNLTAKINELKGELIKDIFDNERAGHSESDALITWDPNPNHKSVEIASVGNCQWKIPTLQESYLKYYGVQLTRKAAIMIALDDDDCKELMTKVIFSEENGWKKWYNSGVKVKALARLEVIRELEK